MRLQPGHDNLGRELLSDILFIQQTSSGFRKQTLKIGLFLLKCSMWSMGQNWVFVADTCFEAKLDMVGH